VAAAGKTTLLLVTSVACVAVASTPAYAVDLTASAPDEFVNRPGWAGVGLNLGNIETRATARCSTAPAQGRYTVYADGAIGVRYYL
jgi:hypothetical protein